MLTYRCIDCKACQVACTAENHVPPGKHRNWIKREGPNGTFPNLTMNFLPGNCMHCGNPPCVRVCPTSASYQREDGIVAIDQPRCIGCKYCIAACPYGARYFDPERKVTDKCGFCLHRLEKGQDPACVATCIGEARVYGDLNDPDSRVSRLLRRYPYRQVLTNLGTEPAVYYIDARPEEGGGGL
ncbi:4Fe-4S ferredoxin [Clostridiales bacterium PH28_bin88]|nr:4Fe-4S ferredoxin [Clostridiales bacterium PH28_bin88]